MTRIFILLYFILLISSCSKKTPQTEEENPFYNRAYDLQYGPGQNLDSAFYFYNQAKDIFSKIQDSLGVAKCYMNMGIISTTKGDYFGGQDFSITATSYFNSSNAKHHVYILSNLNNLGLASQNLTQYHKALDFYQQSLAFTTNHDDIVTLQNNMANTYRRLGDIPKAIEIYNKILKEKHSGRGFAKTLSNRAYTKWLQDSSYNAAPMLRQALEIRLKEGDPEELIASYGHLADYYIKRKPDSALFFATKMYQMANLKSLAIGQIQALQKLIALGKLTNVKRYFERYREVDDSIQDAHTIAINRFALIRYESEKSKADLSISQADNAEKQNSILKRNVALGLSAIILIGGIFWYRKRKKRLQQEKELEVKNTELRYTKKVHDHVANKVYHVMSEVEYNPDFGRDVLLDNLEAIYHISRDISYERKENYGGHFAQKLNKMLNSYSSTKIFINGNEEELWYGVDETCKSEVFSVLQELMTNMKKHSRATSVTFDFDRDNSSIQIRYADNGIGMKEISPKNGLKNTETRIQNILGSITFEHGTEKGLTILISFPFTK